MNNNITIEIKKMVRQRTFLLVLVTGMVIAFLQSIWAFRCIFEPNLQLFSDVMANGDDKQAYFPTGILECWIGCENYSVYNSLLIAIMPLLATIPYSWSLRREWDDGYALQVYTVIGKKRYLCGKLIAVFLSGMLSVAIPLIANALLELLYVPVIKPDLQSLQCNINETGIMSNLYFQYPLLYIVCYSAVDCFVGGVWALLSTVISMVEKNRITALLFPFVLQIFISYVEGNIAGGLVYCPDVVLNPAQPVVGAKLMAVCGAFCVLCVTLLVGIYVLFRKMEDFCRGNST